MILILTLFPLVPEVQSGRSGWMIEKSRGWFKVWIYKPRYVDVMFKTSFCCFKVAKNLNEYRFINKLRSTSSAFNTITVKSFKYIQVCKIRLWINISATSVLLNIHVCDSCSKRRCWASAVCHKTVENWRYTLLEIGDIFLHMCV